MRGRRRAGEEGSELERERRSWIGRGGAGEEGPAAAGDEDGVEVGPLGPARAGRVAAEGGEGWKGESERQRGRDA